MNFEWNADTIRWYVSAGEYTGFFKEIARAVSPMLEGYKSFCDLGCGPALADFELYPLLERIDCVDINDTVLDYVRDRVARQKITNIHTVKADAKALQGAWDVVYVSFFGASTPDDYLHLCRKLIIVSAMESESGLFPSKDRKYRRPSVTDIETYLNDQKTNYRLTRMELEFGQPFVSRQDAMDFLRAYSKGITIKEAEDFLSANLMETGAHGYPLYIPRGKSVGIFELDGTLR